MLLLQRPLKLYQNHKRLPVDMESLLYASFLFEKFQTASTVSHLCSVQRSAFETLVFLQIKFHKRSHISICEAIIQDLAYSIF